MNYVSMTNFQHMITRGAKHLISYEKDLNAINVFPVPDGDTGSNLAFLMNMILLQQPKAYSKSQLDQLKLACLQGSRGNSGMIFSQFIIAMCDFISDKQHLSREQFVEMFDFSFKKTYQAVHQPQEGTILTVMRDWVDSLKQYRSKVNSIPELLTEAFHDAKASLEKTKHAREEFRRQNVVDAGAKGFCYFLHGFIEGLSVKHDQMHDNITDGSQNLSHTAVFDQTQTAALHQVSHLEQAATATIEREQSNEHAFHVHESAAGPLHYRYCTEFIVTNVASEEELKMKLAKHGDSLVFIGSQSFCKLHIHTDKPHEIAELLLDAGDIMFQKVEDMQRQQHMLNKNKQPIAIVIDSACDLPQPFLDQHHIHMLPLSIMVNGSHFLDKQTLTAEQLYKLMKEGKTDISSSLPSREQIMRLYNQLLDHYEHVVSIHVSSQLSGTFAACKQIADDMQSNKLHVVDSRTLSGAYALIVKQFAEQLTAKAEQYSFAELMNGLDKWINDSRIYVTVPSLRSMVNSGRLSSTTGKIADYLSVKPIVTIDTHGKSKLLSPTMFKRSNIPQLIKLVSKVHKQTPIREYALLYTDETTELDNIKMQMQQLTGKLPSFTTTVSSVIGKYAGSGAYSISLLLDNERNNV